MYDVVFNDEVVEVAKKAMLEPFILANDIGGGTTQLNSQRGREIVSEDVREIVSRKYYSREGRRFGSKVYVTETRVRSEPSHSPLMRAKTSLPASLKLSIQ